MADRDATRARILCRTGDLAGATHDLPPDATLGRAEDNDIIVGSAQMSRRHARIWFEDDRWWIEDLGSRNGTRVDGTPVKEPVPLDKLHVITFADAVDFVFVHSATLSAGAGRERRPADASARPREEAPARGRPVERAKPPAPEEEPRTHRSATVADLSAFGALPDLDEGEPAEEPEPIEPEPETAEQDEPVRRPTVADLSAFGALPDLDDQDVPEEPEAREEPRPEVEEAPPAGEPQRNPTVADLSAFGALPDLDEGEPAKEPEPVEEEPKPAPPSPVERQFRATVADLSALGELQELETNEPEAPTVQWKLRADVPGRGATALPLSTGDTILGRSDTCDIVLTDPEKVLSRRHAMLSVDENGVTLTDLDSANGTWVAGQRVERVALRPGDRFRLGPSLEFELVRSS